MTNAELKRLAHLLNDIEQQSLQSSDTATTFDLVVLLCDLVILIRPHVAKKIRLEVSASQPYLVHLPESTLRQALLNLLLNATEAVDKKLSGHIAIKVDKTQAHLIIQFSDNGTGFSKAFLSSGIPLLRSSRQQQNGLGLAMTQHFVKSMGGRIKLSNHFPQGACITILFPESCLVEST